MSRNAHAPLRPFNRLHVRLWPRIVHGKTGVKGTKMLKNPHDFITYFTRNTVLKVVRPTLYRRLCVIPAAIPHATSQSHLITSLPLLQPTVHIIRLSL